MSIVCVLMRDKNAMWSQSIHLFYTVDPHSSCFQNIPNLSTENLLTEK